MAPSISNKKQRLPDVFLNQQSLNEVFYNQLITSYMIVDIENILNISFTFKCNDFNDNGRRVSFMTDNSNMKEDK